MAKPNHFWKWYIGRFWYFDVSKESGENNLAFQGFAKLVGLSPTRLDPAWNEPSDSPLSPTEHLEHIETYLYTPRQSHIFIFIPKTASGAKRCQQTLPDNRRFISPCKIESISSQPTKLTKPWKARLFTPDTFETSKYQNLPIYHFQKWLGFASFCDFDTRHKEITIHSLFGSPCIAICSSFWNFSLKENFKFIFVGERQDQVGSGNRGRGSKLDLLFIRSCFFLLLLVLLEHYTTLFPHPRLFVSFLLQCTLTSGTWWNRKRH